MTKQELIAKLIVMGFKRYSHNLYQLQEQRGNTTVILVFDKNTQVSLDYARSQTGHFGTYKEALTWICENAKTT